MTHTNTRLKKSAALGGAAIAAAAPLVTTTEAHASTITVTNTNDSGAGSLRQAIIDANGSLGADTIDLTGVSGTITLSSNISISDAVTITGPGSSTLSISGDDSICILYISGSDSDVTISGVTFADGNCTIGAGAISGFGGDLTLDDVSFTGNVADGVKGGAVKFDSTDGVLSITDSSFTGNSSTRDGGAIYVEDTLTGAAAGVYISGTTLSGNTAGEAGGAIYFYDPDSDIVIVDSTVSGNTAASNGGGIYFYDTDDKSSITLERVTVSGNSASESGGGLFFYAVDGDVEIINSTISGNTAGGNGGGLYISDTAYLFTIAHSTITANIGGEGGGIYNGHSALTIDHTIVSGNTGTISGEDVEGSDVLATTWSLIGDPSTVNLHADANTITGVGPQLAPLANNGGKTLTHMPLASSRVIDAGDPAFTGEPLTDQRGTGRVQNGRIDIGAVEVVVEPALPPTGSSNGVMAALATAAIAVGASMRRVARRARRTA